MSDREYERIVPMQIQRKTVDKEGKRSMMWNMAKAGATEVGVKNWPLFHPLGKILLFLIIRVGGIMKNLIQCRKCRG